MRCVLYSVVAPSDSIVVNTIASILSFLFIVCFSLSLGVVKLYMGFCLNPYRREIMVSHLGISADGSLDELGLTKYSLGQRGKPSF